jgi:hypothetical protein
MGEGVEDAVGIAVGGAVVSVGAAVAEAEVVAAAMVATAVASGAKKDGGAICPQALKPSNITNETTTKRKFI